MRLWKKETLHTQTPCNVPSEAAKMQEKLQFLIASGDALYHGIDDEVAAAKHDTNGITRSAVDTRHRPWSLLLPHYFPPRFSKQAHAFPIEMQRSVDEDSESVS